MIQFKNIVLVLKDQGPFKRFFRNFFITGNARGLLSIRSHQREDGKLKVAYNTKETATKVAGKMSIKHGTHFSNYKCLFCDGYHLGKNRDNKITNNGNDGSSKND